MKYKIAAFGLILAIAATLAVSAGGESGALVTLSYLKTLLLSPIETYINTSAGKVKAEALSEVDGGVLNQADKEQLAASAASVISGGSRQVVLGKGQRVTGPLGAGFILQSGQASINSFTGSDVIDITAGGVAPPGTAVTVDGYYMVGINNGCGMTITSESANVTLVDGAYAMEGYTPVYSDIAKSLEEMGLFNGTDRGFELERAPTRQEALIMLIRLLGDEKAALDCGDGTPFADLAGWADGKRYIAYGYKMGYTNGISQDTFNQYGSASRHVYLTYVLRALGYSDSQGDFIWDSTSDDLAVKVGLMTRAQLQDMASKGFYRDHVALISHNALKAYLKDGSMTLGERLAISGMISWDSYFSLK